MFSSRERSRGEILKTRGMTDEDQICSDVGEKNVGNFISAHDLNHANRVKGKYDRPFRAWRQILILLMVFRVILLSPLLESPPFVPTPHVPPTLSRLPSLDHGSKRPCATPRPGGAPSRPPSRPPPRPGEGPPRSHCGSNWAGRIKFPTAVEGRSH